MAFCLTLNAVTPSRRHICNFHLLKEVGDWAQKMSTLTLHYILLYNYIII